MCIRDSRIIFSFLYEPLFAVTDGYEAEPILAESYLVTDDGKTTTVKLRSGVTFHDGTAMTAADAAYSIASAMGSEYYGSRLRFIIEAQAQDDLTLVLATSEAYECLPPVSYTHLIFWPFSPAARTPAPRKMAMTMTGSMSEETIGCSRLDGKMFTMTCMTDGASLASYSSAPRSAEGLSLIHI